MAAVLNCDGITDAQNKILCEALVAQGEALEQVAFDTNSFFLIWGAGLVIFMHAGFAMLSAGAVRSKNTRNILISITMDMCICAVGWYLVGFAFGFGPDVSGFIGNAFFVGLDVGSPTGVTFAFWLFEFSFAATSATIVSGSVAERMKFESYMLTSFWMSIFVFPVAAHWVWGGGFLQLGSQDAVMKTGAIDFAGCGPVHMVGGLAGGIASKIIGPRIGRFDASGNPVPIPGHNASLATLGTLILIVGWLGFNPGSIIVLVPGGGALAARAGVNSVISFSGAALSALTASHWQNRRAKEYDLGMALNGALAGLVSITGCCAAVEMWAALCIGIIGGLIYVWGSWFTLFKMGIDDPLDAFPLHYICGIWGLIAGGFFANPKLILQLGTDFGPDADPSGVFYGGGDKGALLASQITEIVTVTGWVLMTFTPLIYILRHFDILRVNEEEEREGLDSSVHGGAAYPDLFHNVNYAEGKSVPKAANGEAPPAAEAAAADVEAGVAKV